MQYFVTSEVIGQVHNYVLPTYSLFKFNFVSKFLEKFHLNLRLKNIRYIYCGVVNFIEKFHKLACGKLWEIRENDE